MSQTCHGWIGAALVLLMFCGPELGHADNGWEGRIFSLNWENDAFAGADRHYTQGIKIQYLSHDNQLPGWGQWLSNHLPTVAFQKQADKLGGGIGQEIYTPENLLATEVVEDDQPYAGWLYGSLILQRRGVTSPDWPTMETLRLDLGVVGPESLAEQAQKSFHGVAPQGWDHQLKTEPGLELRYDRRYLVSWRSARAWGVDIVPYGGAKLGNINISLNCGALVRFGWNVPNEFEVPHARTPPRFGFYFLSGVEGRLVGHDIFLDGNTFRSSHSVHKELLVGKGKVGLVLVLKRLEISFTQTFLTKEFRRQETRDTYSSMQAVFKF